MSQATGMRVVVVAGLHHEARTRTVDALLSSTPSSIAVHHDLSRVSEGEVYRRLRDRWGVLDRQRVDLVHACVSCTLRENLLPLLVELAHEQDYAVCVVEAWDGVEPQMVADAISRIVDASPLGERLSLAAVITAVDEGLLVADLASADDMQDRRLGIAEQDDRTVAEVLIRQIEYPTVLALSGRRAEPGVWEEARALLEHLNPAGAVMAPVGERLSLVAKGRFVPETAAARLDPACFQPTEFRRDGRVETVTWRRTRPMDPGRLHTILDEAVDAGIRSRGRFWLASRPDTMLVWDAGGGSLAIGAAGPWLGALPDAAWDLVSETRRASARIDWRPDTGDRCQCISFTGIGLDAERIIRLLDSCLLTDEELRDPLRQWETEPDPFAGALDVAF